MREQLRALVRLAEIDNAAKELRRELAELPISLQEMKQDVHRLDQMLEAERSELSEAVDLQTAHEAQRTQSGDPLSRAKAKGAKARNAREAEAAEREMEIARRTIREREEEQERLRQAIVEKQQSLETRETKLKEFKELFAAEEQQTNARIAELEQEVSKVTAGREAVTATLPKPLVNRYERFRTRHDPPVVEVLDGTCQGCRLQIPPQQFNQLHQFESIEQCPHCLRFIYLRHTLEDSTPD